MGFLQGKRALVTGIASQRSIAPASPMPSTAKAPNWR